MNRATPTRAVALLCVCLITVPVWSAKAARAPELPDPGHAGMSKDKQEQLGLKTAAEVYKQMPVLPDSSPEKRNTFRDWAQSW